VFSRIKIASLVFGFVAVGSCSGRSPLLGKRTCTDEGNAACCTGAGGNTVGKMPETQGAGGQPGLVSGNMVPWSDSPRFESKQGWAGAAKDFLSIWGSSSSDIWVLANGATDGSYAESKDQINALIHWDGNRWSNGPWWTSTWPISSPVPTYNLKSVWGTGSDDVWVVGELGAVARFDGHGWSAVACPSSATLMSIWGRDRDDLWAVGTRGTILHWNGSTWSTVAPLTQEDLLVVRGSSPTDVWAVGRNSQVLHWDGAAWSVERTVSSTVKRDIAALWSRNTDDAWLMGSEGLMVRKVSGGWDFLGNEAPGLAATDFLGMWGLSLTDVWAVGTNGSIAHFGGNSWTLQTAPTHATLRSVWAGSPSDVWAVGDQAAVLRFDGRRWRNVGQATSNPLFAIWGSSPDDVWAAGQDFVHFDGSTWTRVDTPIASDVLALWGSGGNDIWAGGIGGAILHFDGGAWLSMPSPTSGDIKGIWGSSRSDVWAVDATGTISHFDGRQWSRSSAASHGSLTSIWGRAKDDVLAVGDDVRIHWDGMAWSPVAAQSEVHGHWQVAFGAPGGDIWIGGGQGWSGYKAGGTVPILSRWNGETFAEVPLAAGSQNRIEGGWAASDDAVWVTLPWVGSRMMYWDGSRWIEEIIGSGATIGKIWGNERDIWALGPDGSILRKQR
jgi:hypothetical protein